MNLLIVFVIVLVLLVSEMGNSHPVDDVWLRLTAIMVTTFLVPTLAAFQTVIVTRKLRSDEYDVNKIPTMLKRLTACHSAVWLIASLAIVYSFQWQKIVRGNWGLEEWLLLDEILIIAPVVLSLVASWAIFFDIQTVFAPSKKLKTISQRIRFVALRVRVYLAIFLVPMLLTIAAKDFLDQQIASSNAILFVGIFIGLPVLLASFPFIVMFVWQTAPIENDDLRQVIEEVVTQHRLKVATIRVWSTSKQIVNAVVAGVFPWCRVILVSDAMFKQFQDDQLAAIVRHEAGHIRRWHLPLRMFFIVLPLVIFLVAESIGQNIAHSLENAAALMSLTPEIVMPTLTVGYCIYLVVVLTWLSHLMEFDADQYAMTKLSNNPHELCMESAEQLEEALLRFAELMPSQVDRKSFWHPTIRQRLVRIARIKRTPSLLRHHAENFTYYQFLLFCGIVSFSTLFLMLVSFLSVK